MFMTVMICIVVYKRTARQLLGKKWPFLGNGSVNMFLRQQIPMQQYSYCWKRGVSTWSVSRCYKQGTKSVVREFCTGGCEERTWPREAEDSPVRSHWQGMADEDTSGWKKLSGCCSYLWIVEISSDAIIACSSELCVQGVNKSRYQSKPCLQSPLNHDSIPTYYRRSYWSSMKNFMNQYHFTWHLYTQYSTLIMFYQQMLYLKL
jgi:hypothetical protein